MEQVSEGSPKAVLELNGTTVTRSEIADDWGSRMQWKVMRDGKQAANVTSPGEPLEKTYEHPDKTPGKYEVVLQMFKYVNYKKDKAGGEYVDSKYVDISNVVAYTV